MNNYDDYCTKLFGEHSRTKEDCPTCPSAKIIAKHDSELLDKVAEKIKAQFKDMQFKTGRAWFDFDAGIDRCAEKVDKVIAEMKAEVNQ